MSYKPTEEIFNSLEWEKADGKEINKKIVGSTVVGSEPIDYPITNGLTLYLENSDKSKLALSASDDFDEGFQLEVVNIPTDKTQSETQHRATIKLYSDEDNHIMKICYLRKWVDGEVVGIPAGFIKWVKIKGDNTLYALIELANDRVALVKDEDICKFSNEYVCSDGFEVGELLNARQIEEVIDI